MVNKKKVTLSIVFATLIFILLDFVPVKFAAKDIEGTVFINEFKLGERVEWAEIEYKDGKIDYDIMSRYIIEGNSPDKILNKKEFDRENQLLRFGGNKNKFLIHYDQKKVIDNSGGFSIYKIVAEDWEILYPIHRASFRRFYTPKGFLTIYDFLSL